MRGFAPLPHLQCPSICICPASFSYPMYLGNITARDSYTHNRNEHGPSTLSLLLLAAWRCGKACCTRAEPHHLDTLIHLLLPPHQPCSRHVLLVRATSLSLLLPPLLVATLLLPVPHLLLFEHVLAGTNQCNTCVDSPL